MRIKNCAAALTIGVHIIILVACSSGEASSSSVGSQQTTASAGSVSGTIQSSDTTAAGSSSTAVPTTAATNAPTPAAATAPTPVAATAPTSAAAVTPSLASTADSAPPASKAATPPVKASTNATAASTAGETLTGDTNRPNNSTFTPGDPVEITFHAEGLPASTTTSLAVQVVDELGTEVTWSALALKADSAGKATTIFEAPASKLGFYQVEAKLPNATVVPRLGTRPAGIITYAVVPDPAGRAQYGDAGSRFGMQGGFSHAQGNVVSFLGVHYLLEGPAWRGFEPQSAGQFAAEISSAVAKGQTFPFRIANNEASWPTYGIPLVITADGVPDWAMQPGTGTKSWPHMGALNSAGTEALPLFAKALAASTVVGHAKQSARYYQMTWEPEMPTGFGGTPEQLVELYKLSYSAIHASDPKAIVMGPTLFPGDHTTLGKLLSAGLANYIDAVSMHPYVSFPPESNGLVSNIRLQQQMVATAKGHAIPFVGTEHGYASGVIGLLDQALGNVREAIILLGEGFRFDFAFYVADFWQHDVTETQGTFGYYWNLNPAITYGTDKIGPKPVVPAFAAMTYWLDGTTTRGPIANLSGTQMGYRFHRGASTILALWDFKSPSSTVTLHVASQTIQICNWMDNCSTRSVSGEISLPVGPTPTYVIGPDL